MPRDAANFRKAAGPSTGSPQPMPAMSKSPMTNALTPDPANYSTILTALGLAAPLPPSLPLPSPLAQLAVIRSPLLNDTSGRAPGVTPTTSAGRHTTEQASSAKPMRTSCIASWRKFNIPMRGLQASLTRRGRPGAIANAFVPVASERPPMPRASISSSITR